MDSGALLQYYFLQSEHHPKLNQMLYWSQNTKLTVSSRNRNSPFLIKNTFKTILIRMCHTINL